MPDVYRQNLQVIGENLDSCENNASTLLEECFPDTTVELITYFERVYQTLNTGTLAARRARVIAAIQARGGLTKTYFETLGNALGAGVYTVVITPGTGNLPFVVHEYSPHSSPAGPATELPGAVYDPPFGQSPYQYTVTVTGSAGPELPLEVLLNRLRCAWIEFLYVYVP